MAIAKYEEVRLALLRALGEERWATGARLPGLSELAPQMGASEWATERALTILITQGLLERRPKHGTFVAARPVQRITDATPVVVMGQSLANTDSVYWGTLLASIQEQLVAHDWIYLRQRPAREAALALRMLGAVSLFAITPSREDISDLLHFARTGIAVVCVSTRAASPLLHYVSVDNTGGILQGLKYLARLGHRRIAYLGYYDQYDHRERVAAFKKGRGHYDLHRSPDYLVWHRHPEGELALARLAVERWFGLPNPPTAIFAGGCDISPFLLTALAERQISCPRDISLLAFDDLPLSEHMATPLTVIRQPWSTMGRRIAEAFYQLADASHPQIDVVFPTELVVRASCAPPRK